ncbi:recombinase family protein [Microbacterium sp. SORGH_AS_0421]|uniref:recombinase family protein n=1 Tax=Microbacterium sp. SORGH_AS_0421 TaxID=3041768 RepID=UPI0027915D47|nr:recombinase family protein [Microbacterium sp. SORGH_AS_0421]MDQ1175416.1 site-specific DNA recombinase [Microbacterium sp. SORGH_AS_0421]
MASREQFCAIYTRISDDREGEERGVQRQEEDCRERAEELGLTVYEVYKDNDRGASDRSSRSKKKQRDDYIRMLADAKDGKFATIIAYSNSRLTRRVREWLDLADLWKQYGVAIRTVKSGDRDLTNGDERAVALTLATWDANEVDRISERVRRTNRQKALEGKPAKQHRRPFGFEEDQITHRPEEAQAIREAIHDIIAGASITDICRKWERLGIRTSDGKESWKWTPMKRVLLGWRTVGIREYPQRNPQTGKLERSPLFNNDGEMVKGTWDAIISLTEREAALQKLQERTRASERKGQWLLQGILKCGICSRTLYGALQREGVDGLYTCTGSGKTHLGINAPTLEQYIQNLILRYELEKALHGNPRVDPTQKIWPKEGRYKQLEGLIEAQMEAFSSGYVEPRDHFKQLGILTKERDALERERAKFELMLLDRPNRVATIADAQRWFIDRTSLEFVDLRQLILNEIDFIVIGKGSKGYGGRTHAAVRQEKIWARAEVFWKAPHYTWNGISTEELLDMPIQLTGALGESAPSSATVPSEPVEEWTPEAVSARLAVDGKRVPPEAATA